MKQIALYIILFSYSMVMLKPVAPYIQDTVAHIFYYTQHMATVHYENGKMHVHKEVMDNVKKEASQKKIPASKKDNSTPDHISFQQKGTTTALPVHTSYPIAVTTTLLCNYLAGEYPPRQKPDHFTSTSILTFCLAIIKQVSVKLSSFHSINQAKF